MSRYVKSARVKQVLADLALSQVANRRVDTLTTSEHRRLTIGTQLVRDPVVLLLDEPTWDQNYKTFYMQMKPKYAKSCLMLEFWKFLQTP